MFLFICLFVCFSINTTLQLSCQIHLPLHPTTASNLYYNVITLLSLLILKRSQAFVWYSQSSWPHNRTTKCTREQIYIFFKPATRMKARLSVQFSSLSGDMYYLLLFTTFFFRRRHFLFVSRTLANLSSQVSLSRSLTVCVCVCI